MPNDWGFFGSTNELPGSVRFSAGVCTVTFADDVSFSFPMSLEDDAQSDDNWHFYSVRAEISKRGVQFNIGSALVLNPYELVDVWEALRDYPALEFIGAPWKEGGFEGLLDVQEYGDPVSTGDRTVVDLFGPVTHIVDHEKMVLINRTEATHALHDGYVARHVFDDGNRNYFSLQSIGFGVGSGGGPNSFFSPMGWDHAISDIIEAFASQKYTERTGEDSSRVIVAVP